jgi:hypothetical protein
MSDHTINSTDFIKDFRAGVDDSTLMSRYGLTEGQLERVMMELTNYGLITDTQLEDRAALSDTLITKSFIEASKDSKEVE